MRKLLFTSLFCFYLACPLPLLAQDASHALFVENAGQWENSFSHKLRLSSGALFFENSGYTLRLTEPMDGHHHHDHQNRVWHPHDHHDMAGLRGDKLKGHIIKLKFLGANVYPNISGARKTEFYYNYIKGRNQSQWYSNVGVYRQLNYEDIYPGIDIRYFGDGENLKYDFIVEPGANPELIKMQYTGADKLSVKGNRLTVYTSVGNFTELIPSVYQIINGEKLEIKAKYILKGNVVSIKLGDYYVDSEIIIDPTLVFSSFSGSTADNWGFTATYDVAGHTYAGGIVKNDGGSYPTVPGSYQTDFQGAAGDVDIGISKFSEQGNQLIYSTFIGGSGVDIPQSLIVDESGDLYILGVTASDNFPMPNQNAYQSTFLGGPKPNHMSFSFDLGTDIFISRLNFDGQTLEASTYLGGTETDGLNLNIFRNYGDDARGEILQQDGRVFIISSTSSTDISLTNSHIPNNQGGQDMLIASFDIDLTTMNWGTYFGGSDDDAGYSIKSDSRNRIYIAGGTKSNDVLSSAGAINPDHLGGLDGYIAKFEDHTGTFLEGSYIGTTADDQVFLIDLDKDDHLYAFGQSKGSITISPNHYSNSGSQQFIKKLDNDLDAEQWSTQIGSGLNKNDLVPTAFLVDDCYNIYMSGWNGASNKLTLGGIPIGNTNGLPYTTDAHQTTTDGSDFYFMVLDRDAQNLMYGSYFGGTSNEHVDGGTSRFDPDGSIFQAVCAGCDGGTFPTTPGAYSPNMGVPANGSTTCNLGVIKFDFEITVRSKPEIDFSVDIDTICDSLRVTFTNRSVNADVYQWDFGNGKTSSDAEPSTFFSNFGSYDIQLIALDTNCGISDTSYVSLEHLMGSEPQASFQSNYFSCDSEYNASFNNFSKRTHLYEWDFGDGTTSYDANPNHQFTQEGTYIVSLTAFDSVCYKFATFSDTIVFQDTVAAPAPIAKIAECGDGSLDIQLENDKSRFRYTWNFGTDGETSNAKIPLFYYSEPGAYTIRLNIEDPVCGKEYNMEYPVVIENIGRKMFIPNAFSPNGDGLNESFEIFGNHCGTDAEIRIFNRWGELVFQSDRPFEEFWDAQGENGVQAPIGIYTYSIRNGSKTTKGSFTLFR